MLRPSFEVLELILPFPYRYLLWSAYMCILQGSAYFLGICAIPPGSKPIKMTDPQYHD